MPANVEIKAHISDVNVIKDIAHKLSGEEPTIIHQDDTFFNVPNGRLKLRKLQGQKSQLIHYERSDKAGPKFSEFTTSETDEPETLEVVLGNALGIKGKVKKTRLLYNVGQTRVHVDNVEGLGEFMELEVRMMEGQTTEQGQVIANDLMKKLGIQTDSLISCAYMDLILKKAGSGDKAQSNGVVNGNTA